MQQPDNQMLCDVQVSAECWAGEAGGAHQPGVCPGAGPGSPAGSIN
jgi:hypothetical protein